MNNNEKEKTLWASREKKKKRTQNTTLHAKRKEATYLKYLRKECVSQGFYIQQK